MVIITVKTGGGATYGYSPAGVHYTSAIYGTGTPQVTSVNKANLSIDPDTGHYHPINTDGESGTDRNLPPYYALAFIMRVF